MPLDGILLHHVTRELQTCIGCRADKIHQPSRDELVLLLRSAEFTGKLLISTRSGSARVHVTSASFDNPAEPPAFCKLLRRHLSSAKLTEISQDGLDRLLILRFMTYNEMGDTIFPYLVVELITGRSNLILCDQNGRILDALHRSDIESGTRLIQPGATYTPPEKAEKLNPFTASAEELLAGAELSGKAVDAAFTSTVDGVSPLVSREIAAAAGTDFDIPFSDVSAHRKKALYSAVLSFKERLSDPVPTMLAEKDGTPKDFCYMPITQYGELYDVTSADNFSSLLDIFYLDRDRSARIKALARDVLKTVTNARNRIERKLSYRTADLEKCKNREELRIFGELLKANLYSIEKGATVARVQNYYDENLAFVEIPLDPALSPAANAAKYFKDYKKTYTAQQTLSALIEEDRKELMYLDSVLDSLSRCTDAAGLSEIKEELYEAGYLHRSARQKTRPTSTRPKEFTSPGGFRVLVGKNNRENDLITTKLASKQDLWFHTKNFPGSHVILITEGRTPENEDLLFAASLAAANSKAADSDKVPVDYTEIKNVKKPGGAKPGMVIYTSNRTIYAKPCKFHL